MPRRIGNTNVPRNPVAQSPLLRRGGVHQKSKSSTRADIRKQTDAESQNWREELEAESPAEPGDQIQDISNRDEA